MWGRLSHWCASSFEELNSSSPPKVSWQQGRLQCSVVWVVTLYASSSALASRRLALLAN